MYPASLGKMHARKGLMLVGVLWIVVILITMIIVIGRTVVLDGRAGRMVTAELMRNKWACKAGFETALAVLETDDPATDSLVDLWSNDPEDFNDIQLDMCRFSVKVIDDASMLNINTATKEQLMELPDMTEEIADSILDWRDSDEEIRPAGAESGYYLNLPYPYYARNGNFKTLRELLLVRGVTPALFYGRQDYGQISSYNTGWINYLTCYSSDTNKDVDGNDRININSANENDMTQKLGISPGNARWIVQNRQFNSIAGLLPGGKTSQPASASSSTQTTAAAAPAASAQPGTFGQPGGRTSSGSSAPSSQGQSSQQNVTAQPLTQQQFVEIADKITVSSESQTAGKININTVSLEVLAAFLKGDYTLASDIIAYRQQQAEGLTSIGQILDITSVTPPVAAGFIDNITTRSSVFTIESKATSDMTGRVGRLEAVVDRSQSPAKILYFRSGAEG